MTDHNNPAVPEILEQRTPSENRQLVRQDIKPDILYLVPIPGRPHLPGQVQQLVVDKKRWGQTLSRASKDSNGILGLAFLDELPDKLVDTENFPKVGCVVRMETTTEMKDQVQLVVHGLERFRIIRFLSDKPPFVIQVSYFQKIKENEDELKAYAIAIISAVKQLLALSPLYSEQVRQFLSMFGPHNPEPLTDFAAGITMASGNDLQEILEFPLLMDRMKKAMMILQQEIEIAKLQNKIQKDLNMKMRESKRSFFLKEQMHAIQKELGLLKDDKTSDADKFKKKFATRSPPEYVVKRFGEEIEKLSVLETGSSEYGVTRNYLDWISAFPWGIYSRDNIDIDRAQKVLDRDHSGLSDVKDRIIEFFAAGIYRKDMAGTILLFVGPPGVGKTSIGKSIAEALGRKFYRFSLGGMKDEAEIKGHRRTYVGALPGRLVQALKDCEVANPVVMLDEVDKIGMSFQGDPASALLEVLDPEQNIEFLDHYMDLRIDLSKVMFICTANQLDSIPSPLLDRMDRIHLSGYITEEKMKIARKHLWPRLLKRNHLTSKVITITDPAIRCLIEGYAREAGVRDLEKLLNKIIRKSIVVLLKEKKEKISICIHSLEQILGSPIFRHDRQMTGVGVATGLAWTRMGGQILPVEAVRVHDKNTGFTLTGNLGEVMQESAAIAYSYVRANFGSFTITKTFFDNAFIHIHVPEGATPKDGPSAGVTMTTALVSLAIGHTINRPLAMTGEITLTGEVLPVGGIREKVIAARRSGIREILLPERNLPDIKRLPEYLKEGITFHFAQKYKDIFSVVFKKQAKDQTQGSMTHVLPASMGYRHPSASASGAPLIGPI